MNSNRYGESRAAYREVQERHQDIKRIEQTIAELAQLFNDVSFRIRGEVGYLCSFSDEYDGRAARRNHQYDSSISRTGRERYGSWVNISLKIMTLFFNISAASSTQKKLLSLLVQLAKSDGFASSL